MCARSEQFLGAWRKIIISEHSHHSAGAEFISACVRARTGISEKEAHALRLSINRAWPGHEL